MNNEKRKNTRALDRSEQREDKSLCKDDSSRSIDERLDIAVMVGNRDDINMHLLCN